MYLKKNNMIFFRGKSFSVLKFYIDKKYGWGKLEMLMSVNWFNPFATLWLNFRSFPLYQAFYLPVFVYGHPRFYGLMGKMIVNGDVHPGMISFNKCLPGAPSNMCVQSELFNQGTIIFHGSGHIGTGTTIHVFRGAILEVGKNFKVADMVNVGCFSKITINDQVRITHRCQIMDTNYHFVANFSKGIVPRQTKPIHIGKGCWICNSTTITGGSIIPDFTIVASHSLVSKDYSSMESGSLIGGIPARFITSGIRKVENSKLDFMIHKFYRENQEAIFLLDDSITEDMVSEIL